MLGLLTSRSRLRRVTAPVTVAVLILGTAASGVHADQKNPDILRTTYSVTAVDGQVHRITNHLTRDARPARNAGPRREWLLVWAGDASNNMASPYEPSPEAPTTDEPDFLAVVDATPGTRTYGKVVNTVTIDSVFGNEPHHMQYQWHKGDKVYAGGLLSDITFVFDVKRLPEVTLSGVVPATATPCGSIPDAYQVLADGSAYGTYLGGPDVPGPCRYTNGETREGNGFGGTPGEIVRISPDGRVLAEAPAASATSDGATCVSIPALSRPSCANPHGIAMREDLNRLLVGDFSEARNLLGGVLPEGVVRDTVRIFDIADRNNPKLVSVTRLPNGPRQEPHDTLKERWGAMEAAMPHRRPHRGGFISTLNGVVYYAPDITVAKPKWRVVYDDYNAFKKLFPTDTPTSSIDGGSWIQLSPDDRYLYRLVMGGGYGSPGEVNTGMLLALDVKALLAAGPRVKCSIDTVREVEAGGAERDCPKLVSVVPIKDDTYGGPHWATMDIFRADASGKYRETDQAERIAVSNYFLAGTGTGGNNQVCMFNVGRRGELSVDRSFTDEQRKVGCLSFNRTSWPHGKTGHARPHGLLFAVADRDLR
jgi:hypothetical protein